MFQKTCRHAELRNTENNKNNKTATSLKNTLDETLEVTTCPDEVLLINSGYPRGYKSKRLPIRRAKKSHV